MKYIVKTEKSIDQAAADLVEATVAHKFGVLHVYDLRATMESKGVAFDREVRVLEVCNPHHAHTALSADIEVNLALPCRISVWENGGVHYIGMLKPSVLLQTVSDAPLADLAAEVEETMVKIIDAAR
jgi:uncharacterized protein (DUF302 family)